MNKIEISVGRRKHSFSCLPKEEEKIKELASQLNILVNKNALKYRTMSDDDLLFITALELLNNQNSASKDDHDQIDISSLKRVKIISEKIKSIISLVKS